MKFARNPLLIALLLFLISAWTPVVLAQLPAPQTNPVNAVEQVQQTDTNRPDTTPDEAIATAAEQSAPQSSLVSAIARRQKLIEADRLYLGGQFAAAQKLYREVKTPFASTTETRKLPEPIVDPAALPPAGKVYWREAEAGGAEKLQTRVMVPLRLLVEQYPQFVPGHLRLAQALEELDHSKEAIDVLERATTLYPQQPELVKAKIATLAAEKQWMEASLAARQYALLNANPQDAAQFSKLAEDYLTRYRKHLRTELRGNAVANVITGALGYALTGSLLGPLSALQTGSMLLRGESSIGNSIAKDAREQLPLVEDKAVVEYVNEIGQKLAQVAGRNDFQYQFDVVLADELNAFALPGGKVFVNAGAIDRTKSEAELAGLIAHELSHAVLSHGFQLVAEGNLISNVTQYLPYGGTVANLFTLSYSRDMERQADTLGTRLIAATGYAADGLHNLMVTLEQQEKSSPPTWLASHPGPGDRVRYLENLIERNRYNRYAYEGVERHARIKARVKKILLQKEQILKEKHQRR